MVEIEDEVSPAAMPIKDMIIWDGNNSPPSNSEVEDDGLTAHFKENGGFRYFRSEEVFTTGSYRFEIQCDFFGKDGQVSFGICDSNQFKADSGVYYFTGAYIYCNYYPSFTRDFTNIHKETPPKLKNMENVAVIFDLDENTISWEINGRLFEDMKIEKSNIPYCLVVGMFNGKATLV